MKKIILLLILCSTTLMAQQAYKEVKVEGKIYAAKVIRIAKGTIEDVQVRYESDAYFSDPKSKFLIDGVEIPSEQIEAFMFDVTFGLASENTTTAIWARKSDQSLKAGMSGKTNLTFVKMEGQGAIESYRVTRKDKLGSSSRAYTRKLDGEAINVYVNDITKEQMAEWIADSPEIMKELKEADSLAEANKNKSPETKPADSKADATKGTEGKPKGLLAKLEAQQKKDAAAKAAPIASPTSTSTDMNLIINNYNAWYEERNKGKIKYYFVDPPVRKNTPLEDFHEKQAVQNAYLKSEKDKADAKSKIDALFASRTTTPSPENASAKDNVPVKKETFAAKLDRIKADGNKVGVILYLRPAQVNAPTDNVSATLTGNVRVEGGYIDESLKGAAVEFVKELNQVFKRTDIELIDINTVPYRNSKFGRLDDWWASKYKVVFAYSLDPRLRTTHEEIGGKMKFAAELNMITSLVVTEFIGGPEATKMDNLAQVLNMGSFVTPRYAQDEDMSDVKLIYDKTLEKLGTPILEKMKTERADAIKKLVEKKLN